MEIGLALGTVVLAITLLSIDRIPIEVSSLTIVVVLALTGLVTPKEALSGFSSETAIFIFALLAMTQGLAATGVMQIVGRRLLSATKVSDRVFSITLLCVVAGFSSVASNTAVTAAFLPVVISASGQLGIPSRRLLMPMAFASMLGGTIFLFGTSTNLVVSGALSNMGFAPIGFAELTPVGLPLAAIGIVTTYLVAKRLLGRAPSGDEQAPALRAYIAEAVVVPGSRFVGRSVQDLANELSLPIHALQRDGVTRADVDEERLRDNDLIVISGSFDDIVRIKDFRSISLRADLRLLEPSGSAVSLVEVAIPPTSMLDGRSLRDIRFADRYRLVVVAVHRHPSLQRTAPELDLLDSVSAGEQLKNLRLAVGDMLLVRGTEERIRDLRMDEDFTVLSEVQYEKPRYDRAALAVIIFSASVAAAGFQLVSPAIAGLTGLLAMIATRCVGASTAFRVDWRVVIMIGALLTLGLAMERSGAGEFAAQTIIMPVATVVGAYGVLVVLMVMTIVLSIPMSNQAAALIMLPIGIHTAADMGVNPRTFAIATCLAASCSFVTPFEPAAALVYGAGRYRVVDFLRVGALVTVVSLVIVALAVPLVWPF